MTNTTKLSWSKPEVLAHGLVWSAMQNAIDLAHQRGLEVTNETISAICDEASAFWRGFSSVNAAGLVRAYEAVKGALAR